MAKLSEKNIDKNIKMLKGVGIAVLCIALAFVLIMSVPVVSARISNGKEVDKNEITNQFITDGNALVVANSVGNTMLSIKQCVSSTDFKADVIKLDVRITSDNKLILMSDDKLDKISNSAEHFAQKGVKVEDKTYDELRELNLGEKFVDSEGNSPYSELRGDKIPDDLRVALLSDVFDYLTQQGDYKFIVEIKDNGKNSVKAVDVLYNIVKERELLSDVILVGNSQKLVKYMDENYSDMLRSASDSEVLRFYLASGFGVEIGEDNIGYEVLQVPKNKSKFIQFDNLRFINFAHNHNVAVQYEVINDHKDMVELNNIGADAIITDEPASAYRIVNKNPTEKTEFVK